MACSMEVRDRCTTSITFVLTLMCNTAHIIIYVYGTFRGEGAEGYSTSLRQWEFTSAFRAEASSCIINKAPTSTVNGIALQQYLGKIRFEFIDALKYRGPVYDPATSSLDAVHLTDSNIEPIPLSQVQAYESAMQYLIITDHNDPNSLIGDFNQPEVLKRLIKSTAERCSLVRTMIHIVAEGDSYEDAASTALSNESFDDMMEHGENANSTWSIRLRRYTSETKDDNEMNHNKNPQYQVRYGKNVRSSLKDEKGAILAMSQLVQLFSGRVNLKEPKIKVYVLEGLMSCSVIDDTEEKNRVLLARVIANGPKVSIEIRDSKDIKDHGNS